MLEEKERVVALLKEVMKSLEMSKKGRVTFYQSGFDFSALAEPGEPPVAPGFCPRWNLTLRYPVGDEEQAKVINFEIVTYDFQTENEIKEFISREIKNQLN